MRQSPDLRALRGDRLLKDVAAELGITLDALSKIERGINGVGLHTAVGLRRIYGIPVETWLPETNPTTGGKVKST